ncbi:MAG: GNAT family N-acetyltransferase [Rhodobacteraceae bacterium]|nr:GNAT family N-acetyltransferase [Paracoccaceae bacterium]
MNATIRETRDLKTCFALRHSVFVEEQNVPIEEEQDELDLTATHLLAEQNGAPVGTARIVFQDDVAKIGRVCVLKDARGTGLGAELIKAAVRIANTSAGVSKARLGAQLRARAFYERLGFTAFGPVYMDAGIEHQDMERTLP